MSEPTPSSRSRLLIVDDVEAMRLTLTTCLQLSGYPSSLGLLRRGSWTLLPSEPFSICL